MTRRAASGKPKSLGSGGVWLQSWNLKELTEGHHQEFGLALEQPRRQSQPLHFPFATENLLIQV